MVNRPTFEVRRAGLAEADDAFHLLDEYYRELDVVVRDSRPELEQYLLGEQSGIWLARSRDGKQPAVGCILLRPLPRMGAAGEMKRMYVRSGYRGAGIAQALLQALEQYAAEHRLRWLYLDSHDNLRAALRLYEHSGYRPCERYNDNPQATMFMRKRLSAMAED